MTQLDALADCLIAAHRSGIRFQPAPPLPTTEAEAYGVQARVAHALGPVAGFKTGLKPGGPSFMAPIRAEFCLSPGARVNMDDRMGIELEVGWKIIAPLPAPHSAGFDAALARAVLPVPVIELVNTRLDGPQATDPLVKLADFQINHGLIIGQPLDRWDGSDFTEVTARCHAGPREILNGAATVPGGSALATLAGLIEVIGDHCGGLQVGQVVITGSLHPLVYLDTPCDVTAGIEGLGDVSLTLVRNSER